MFAILVPLMFSAISCGYFGCQFIYDVVTKGAVVVNLASLHFEKIADPMAVTLVTSHWFYAVFSIVLAVCLMLEAMTLTYSITFFALPHLALVMLLPFGIKSLASKSAVLALMASGNNGTMRATLDSLSTGEQILTLTPGIVLCLCGALIVFMQFHAFVKGYRE